MYSLYRVTATHGIAKAFPSFRPTPTVRPSVPTYACLSNACIVTKRKKLVPTFLYHMKEDLY